MNPNSSLAVIGAGIAGLSCATALQQAGHVVTLFDKSRGPAGRMSTRRGDDWQCDHGAQYFTARDPDFRAELQRWSDAGAAALWTPRLQVFGAQDQHRLDPTLQRWVGTPGMTAPARWLAQALPLQTAATVNQLRRDAEGWRLHTAEGGWLEQPFEAVLLALPAPQLPPLLQACAPGLAALAASVRMRACWALMLQFAAPVDLPFDAAFVNQGPLRWLARNSSKPGRTGAESWLLHADAEWSETHVEQPPEAVAALLLQAFAELGGPAPQTWSAQRWLYADSAPALTQGCAWQSQDGLGLCGDWLNGGKVEGAWMSGQQLARQVLTL
jgi:renalase